MDFVFLKGDKVAFFRSDAQTAEWTQEELNLHCTFPFLQDKVIERGMVVLFQDPATDDWQAYMIRQCKGFTSYQQIEAENLAITELSACHIPEIIKFDNVTAQDALTDILAGTGWGIGAVNSNPVSSGDISRGSVWQNISIISRNWNVYIMPRVTVNASGIAGRYLDLIPASGIDRGLRLAVNKNVTDPCVTYDDSELYTALFGYGGTYSEGSGESRVTLEYNFSAVEWLKTNDHPAKPSGQKYIEFPEMTALYGLNGKPRFGYYQNTGIIDPEILLEKTWETLKTCCEPKISITGTATDLKRLRYADVPLRLHDMAIIELEPLGVQFYKQVVKLTVNLLDPTKNLPTIGDYIPNIIYINRETEDFATGGGKGSGGGRGSSKVDLENSEFKTGMYDNGRQIGIYAAKVDKQGDILQQAGMDIDPETGVLVYAEDTLNMIGSKFRVQSDRITSEVTDRKNADNALSSRITQTANQISIEVSERKSADASLSGRITVEAGRITQEVTDRTNADTALSGRITTESGRITAEVARAQDAETTLSGRITITENAITQEVTDRTNADSVLSGRITTTADAVTAEVTRATAAEGTLSGRITVNADKVSLVVTDDGQGNYKTNSAEIVAGINSQTGSYVKIKADTINLSGYVTMSSFNSLSGTVDGILAAGTFGANKITSTTINATGTLAASSTFNYKGHTVGAYACTTNGGVTFYALGYT